MAVLAQAKPDLFACETIPDIVEVNALVEVLAEFGIPAWISMSAKDGQNTCAGQPIEELAHAVRESAEVVAIGVNCTMPEYVGELLGRLNAVSDLPFVVYPNAGRVWDGEGRCWIGEGLTTIPQVAIDEWVANGALLIGGCCGLGPDAIDALELQN
jgi:homocysteine S-methyltransferase